MHKLSVINAIGCYIITVIDTALFNNSERNLFAMIPVTFISCEFHYFLHALAHTEHCIFAVLISLTLN
jgi:hypothetical protein